MHKESEHPVGELFVDINADMFSFRKNEEYEGKLPAFLVYVSEKMSESERIKMWVMERAPDRDNEFIDVLIEKIGETEYNSYSFFKHNNGAFNYDKFYVTSV